MKSVTITIELDQDSEFLKRLLDNEQDSAAVITKGVELSFLLTCMTKAGAGISLPASMASYLLLLTALGSTTFCKMSTEYNKVKNQHEAN